MIIVHVGAAPVAARISPNIPGQPRGDCPCLSGVTTTRSDDAWPCSHDHTLILQSPGYAAFKYIEARFATFPRYRHIQLHQAKPISTRPESLNHSQMPKVHINNTLHASRQIGAPWGVIFSSGANQFSISIFKHRYSQAQII